MGTDDGNKKGTEKILRCNFCDKSQHEVKKLIAGPSVYICDECVDLSKVIIDSEDSKNSAPSLAELLTPEEIVALLSEHVIGQEVAKKRLAVAAYRHYVRRANRDKKNDVEEEKSNVLLVGPSGSGKTFLAERLATILNVPFARGDGPSLTEAGYVGADVDSMLQTLLENCEMDPQRAAYGIVFIDEIDKIGKKGGGSSSTRDVGGEGVQHALLKMIEGTIMDVPIKGKRGETIKLDTRHILFICGGAFDGLENIIEQRLNTGKGSMGFTAVNVGNHGKASKSLIHQVIPEDLVRFGFDRQLVGRIPVRATLDELDVAMLERILTQPKNAILKQFALNFAQEGATLVCEPDAVIEIAKKAIKEKTGARGLRSICEEIFFATQYTLPTLRKKGENVKKVHLTGAHVVKGISPELVREPVEVAV